MMHVSVELASCAVVETRFNKHEETSPLSPAMRKVHYTLITGFTYVIYRNIARAWQWAAHCWDSEVKMLEIVFLKEPQLLVPGSLSAFSMKWVFCYVNSSFWVTLLGCIPVWDFGNTWASFFLCFFISFLLFCLCLCVCVCLFVSVCVFSLLKSGYGVVFVFVLFSR